MRDESTTGDGQAVTNRSIDGLRTYLECPRRYEFANVHELAGDDDDDGTDDRVDLCRRAICGALGSGERETDALVSVATERLTSLWDAHDERFHSLAQRRHERAVLEATIRAYFEGVGTTHARKCTQLAAASGGELVGPDILLSRSVSDIAPDGTTDTTAEAKAAGGADTTGRTESTVEIESAVDYVYGDDDTVVGVRFVPTLRPLGLLRYRSSWDGGVDGLFRDHFDPESDAFEPGPVAALFETAVVLEGLRTLCDRLDLERRCRYVQIPLADRSSTSVNWVRGTVEATVEPTELTDVYVDELTYGMTHEHRNETVDDRLETIVARLESGSFDPSDRWERIERHACPDCAYTVCCGEYVGTEARFDG